MASEIASGISFGLGVWEHFHDKPLSGFILMVVSLPLFFIGAYLAWKKKHDELELFQSQKPKIEVQVDKVKWRPVQLGTAPYPESDGKSTYDMFVHACLKLEEPASVKILRYRLNRIGTYASHTSSDDIDDLDNWELVCEDYGSGHEQIFPLNPLPKLLSKRGELIDGWIHFHVGRYMEADMDATYRLDIVGEHGNNHGDRPGGGVKFPELSIRRKRC